MNECVLSSGNVNGSIFSAGKNVCILCDVGLCMM